MPRHVPKTPTLRAPAAAWPVRSWSAGSGEGWMVTLNTDGAEEGSFLLSHRYRVKSSPWVDCSQHRAVRKAGPLAILGSPATREMHLQSWFYLRNPCRCRWMLECTRVSSNIKIIFATTSSWVTQGPAMFVSWAVSPPTRCRDSRGAAPLHVERVKGCEAQI